MTAVSVVSQAQAVINVWPNGEPNDNGDKDDKAELTIFLPDKKKATGRAIVMCPGGGYSHLAMQHEGTDWAPYFNQQGIAVFVLKYRMPHGNCAVPISDAEEAIKMVRRNAKTWNVSPDKVGIIMEITKFITDNHGNILYLDQCVDQIDHRFFMRVEWDLEGFLIPKEKISEYITTLYAQRYEMKFMLKFSSERPRMAIFVSKMSHCLYDLLARWKAGELDVEIPCIVSNHEDLRYVADQFGLPYYVFSINKDWSNKREVEEAEMKLLRDHGVTFIVLARYMQIISDDMIAAYPNHIINIHHSFLPAFVGAKPYHQAYERGVKIIGATSHYVTAELDAGPIIEQDVIRITHKDTPETLVLKGKDLEKIVLSRAVKAHIDRKVLAYKNRTIIFS